MPTILDGRKLADELLDEVQGRVESYKAQGRTLKLVVIVVGEDPASAVYVAHKEKACKKIGMDFEKIALPSTISEAELIGKIGELNADPAVTGMIVQLPLPKQIDSAKVIKAINPYKDVDGFHAYNVGKMVLGKEFEDLAPCTPKGIMRMLEKSGVELTGINAVVIGRSNIVGKPVANMLLNRDATVTICHSRTKNLSMFTKEADLIVVAVGKPQFLKADMVKDGVIVVDVGIHRLEDGTLVGDADFEDLKDKVSMITPVPGGVGPMTVACLMANTVTAAGKQDRL